MGKTYLETIKYMIVAEFEIDGLVQRPDVIGAIFGQSEGLLGSKLDIKDLQQNGKIGRIEINVNHIKNQTKGELKLPCSLSMVETAIIGASIESIDKVGPCETTFKVKQIQDTRGIKRKQIKERAIDLLNHLVREQIPDTRELMEEISDTIKVKGIVEYGPDKLAAGPGIDSTKELIIVEGRADVLTMLRYGFTNVISTGGAKIPKSLANICKNKNVTLFLDGDHGGEIQRDQLLKNIKVDYISKAPDGKEVEELTQKEINQALRKKIKASIFSKPTTVQKQPNLVKNTKFSATNQHKVIKQYNKPVLNSYEKPNYNKNEQKDDSSFNNILGNIPVQRIDANDRPKNNFSKDKSNFTNNNYKDKNNNTKNNYKDKSNFTNNNYKSNNKHINQYKTMKENNFKENNNFNKNQTNDIKKDKYIKSTVKVNNSLKQKIDNAMSNKELNNKNKENIDLKKEISKNISKDNESKESLKEVTKKDNNLKKEKKKKSKKPEKKFELAKLTDNYKKKFVEIFKEIEGKDKTRFLNSKLRRVGNSKNSELISKLNGFKPNKVFALVTDREIDQKLVDLAISKNIHFLIGKNSLVKSSDKINIVLI